MSRDIPRDTTSELTYPSGSIYGLINGAAAATVHCWARSDSHDGGTNSNRLISANIATASSGLILNVDGSVSPNKLRISGRSQSIDILQSKNATSTFSTGVWYPCGGIWDAAGDTITPWFNGAAEGGGSVTFGASTFTASTPTDKDAIGGNGANNQATKWDGLIAEMALWSVALTSAELIMLSLGYSPLVVHPRNLVFYAPLIGRYSTEFNFMSSLSGTISGSGIVAGDHPRIFNYVPGQSRKLASAAGATVVNPTAAVLNFSGNAIVVKAGINASSGVLQMVGSAPVTPMVVKPTSGVINLNGNVPATPVNIALISAVVQFLSTNPSTPIVVVPASSVAQFIAANPSVVTGGTVAAQPTSGVVSFIGGTLIPAVVAKPGSAVLNFTADNPIGKIAIVPNSAIVNFLGSDPKIPIIVVSASAVLSAIAANPTLLTTAQLNSATLSFLAANPTLLVRVNPNSAIAQFIGNDAIPTGFGIIATPASALLSFIVDNPTVLTTIIGVERWKLEAVSDRWVIETRSKTWRLN